MQYPGPGWLQDPAECPDLLPGPVRRVREPQEPNQQPQTNPGVQKEAAIRCDGGQFGQKTALQFTN